MNRLFFDLVSPEFDAHQTFCLDHQTLFRVGVPNQSPLFLEVDPTKDILQQIQSNFSQFSNSKLFDRILKPGEYYYRIARSSTQHPNDHGSYPAERECEYEIASAVGQLRSLIARFHEVARSVEPDENNLQTYGHSIRELLIICATEVESHWKAVLKSNGFMKERLTTVDYAKTKTAMRLGEYQISFPSYPKIKPVMPFKDWCAEQNQTKSLSFYNAYNLVKHDREGNFDKATLEYCIAALSACLVMVVAQFGYGFMHKYDMHRDFSIDKTPQWSPSETYCYPYDGFELKPVQYNFDY